MTVKTFLEMGRCEECEWFNPYDGGDGSPGECLDVLRGRRDAIDDKITLVEREILDLEGRGQP